MKEYNVLFTSAGRRVQLVEIFKQCGYATFTADCDPTAPTLRCGDKNIVTPRIMAGPDAYVDYIIDIVKKENIDVVVPLIDHELQLLAQHRQRFSENKALLMLSDLPSVDIAADKYKTFQFFKQIDLPTPQTMLIDDFLHADQETQATLFPAVLKPRYGSAGIGILNCNDAEYVAFHHKRNLLKNYIIQKQTEGEEITTDIFGDGNGTLVAQAQRKRLKIRGGEVERGITVKYPTISNETTHFAKHFKPLGTVNIQCFHDPATHRSQYIEINPRFGGGYPLAHMAGVNFPELLKKMIAGQPMETEPENYTENYRENMIMTRYDSAFFFINNGSEKIRS